MAISLADNRSLLTTVKYICDCGRKCISQAELNEHKSNYCEKRELQCSFCQEPQLSTRHLTDHLMMCGNKTDQCPNCHKFIRRAIFAYHYENNCANLDEPDAPTPPSRISSAHRPSSNISKSVLKKNAFIDDDQENKSDSTSVNDDSDKLQRISSSTSNKRSPTDIKECKYCKQTCLYSDYKAHKGNCLRKPKNLNKDKQRTSFISDKPESRPSTSEGGRSKEIVGIPCEFCNEQIDFNSWATHTEDCRKREDRRIETRAKAISEEPVTENCPCEHCKELYSVRELRSHEILCRKNPEYIARVARPATTQPSTTPSLFNGLTNTQRDRTLLSSYSSLSSTHTSDYKPLTSTQDMLDELRDGESDATLRNERFSSHETINIIPIQERSRSRDRDLSSLGISGYQLPRKHGASDHTGLQLINSSNHVSAYATSSLLPNDRPSSGTQLLSHRLRSSSSLDRSSIDRKSEEPRAMPRRAESPNIFNSRLHSASRMLVDARGSHRSQATKATSHLTGNTVLFHSPREGDLKYQPKLNQPDRPTTHNGIFRSTQFFNPKPWRN